MLTSTWQQSVLNNEGLTDWTIIEAFDAYCWLKTKTIQLPKNASSALFLHEVAHALHPSPEGDLRNHYHGGGWAQIYGRLIEKYLMRLDECIEVLRPFTKLQDRANFSVGCIKGIDINRAVELINKLEV